MNNNFENDLKSLYEHSMGIYKAAKSIYDSIMSKKAVKNPEDDPENEKPEENLVSDIEIVAGGFYRVAPFEEARKDARNPNQIRDFIYGIPKSMWNKLSEQAVLVKSVGKESALIQAHVDDRDVTFYMPICNLRRIEKDSETPSISQMADIILEKDLSLRQAGKLFHIPHTTLYYGLKEELPLVDMGKYYKIKQHLDKNRRNNNRRNNG